MAQPYREGNMKLKRFMTVIMTVMLVLGLSMSISFADDPAIDFSSSDGNPSNNIHLPYADGYHGSITNSYLTWNNNDLVRVEYINGKVIAETYDSSFNVKDRKVIEPELEYFGGFFSGSNAYYIAYGQNNPNESSSVEVFRFVKYDKNWNRLGACSVKGANTKIPFRAGGLAMTEYNGTLYVHTCHQMFKSDDGLNHQANCTFKVQESNMSLTSSYYGVYNLSYGYVSHSFQQKAAVDGTYLYRADLGDAHPRSIALTATKHGSAVSSPSLTGSLVQIPGKTGANYTGFELGGMELSGSNVIVAGCGVTSGNAKMNIFVSSTSKTSIKENVTWITNYTTDSIIEVGTPKLVKLNANQFLLMWEEHNTEDRTYVTKAALLGSGGGLASSVVTMRTPLSECNPVVDSSGYVVWYYTDDSSPRFFRLDPFRLSEAEAQAAELKRIGLCEIYVSQYNLYYSGQEIRPHVTVETVDGSLTEGVDYELIYSNNINAGQASVTINGIGAYSGSETVPFTIEKASHNIQVNAPYDPIELGSTLDLEVTSSTNTGFTFESDNTSVITVDDAGRITAVGEGEAYVIVKEAESDNYSESESRAWIRVSKDVHTMVEYDVKYANGEDNVATITRRCSVCGKEETETLKTMTVIDYVYFWSDFYGTPYVGSVVSPGDEYEISIGGYGPEDADDTTFVVESSDSNVMTVEDNIIRFVGTGTVTMTVYAKYNPSVNYTQTFTVSTEGSADPDDSYNYDDPYNWDDYYNYDNPYDPYGIGSDTGSDTGNTGADVSGAGSDAGTSGAKKILKAGTVIKRNGSRYTVLSGSKKTLALTKAKNKTSFTVPATVKISGYGTFKVVQIKAKAFTGKKIRSVTIGKNVSKIKSKAFYGSKATKVTLRTKKLKKSSVKGSLRGSRVKTIRVRITKKAGKTNKTYVKKYKKYFTKKNAGRKVTVK